MSKSFLWGASTSAHQVEGNNVHNDWWEWEQKTVGVEKSGKACDHYHRFKDDFLLAKSLGHNAHRLSLEWSRIEPERGKWNKGALNHYREVLEELKRQEMKSFVTLHHFTNPAWFMKRGGWTNSEAREEFVRYVKIVVESLGDLVDFWVTINEPMVYATQSYWYKRWPPQKKSLFLMWKVIRNMAAAHRGAYRAIHRVLPDAQVGLAKHLVAFMGEKDSRFDDRFVMGLEDLWFNHFFYSLTKRKHDFIGVNNYFTITKQVKTLSVSIRDMKWEGAVSDLNWPIRPEGLKHVLKHMKRYGLPVYITENGLADADDSKRVDFIRDYLRAIEEAQKEGVDVRGYLHWSFMDNFEWAEGFKPRFGLVEIDYETMERKPRPSAYVYKAIIDSAQSR
jgi:beta-glucosidase